MICQKQGRALFLTKIFCSKGEVSLSHSNTSMNTFSHPLYGLKGFTGSLSVSHHKRPWVAHLRMTDRWSGTICEILVECIMRNNSVDFFEFGSVVQEMSIKKFLIWSFGSRPVWCSRTIYAILKDGIMGNIHLK